MSFDPVTVNAIDQNGGKLFEYRVPFFVGMSARQALECAFIVGQAGGSPDPFLYMLQYYGYSKSPEFPGYLGY